MYELKKTSKVFMSKFVGNGPSSYKKRVYHATVSQRLRNIALESYMFLPHKFIIRLAFLKCSKKYTYRIVGSKILLLRNILTIPVFL
jgi:hypothetical protein